MHELEELMVTQSEAAMIKALNLVIKVEVAKGMNQLKDDLLDDLPYKVESAMDDYDLSAPLHAILNDSEILNTRIRQVLDEHVYEHVVTVLTERGVPTTAVGFDGMVDQIIADNQAERWYRRLWRFLTRRTT